MELWSPPHDSPHLLEWWRPLMLVARRARADRFPWPVHLDEFRLTGRVKRQGRPDIWIYDHHENGGSVCVDSRGRTYKFLATPRGKGPGQFRECPVRTALWRARLPDVVEPVWYDEQRLAPWEQAEIAHAGAGAPTAQEGAAAGAGPAAPGGPDAAGAGGPGRDARHLHPAGGMPLSARRPGDRTGTGAGGGMGAGDVGPDGGSADNAVAAADGGLDIDSWLVGIGAQFDGDDDGDGAGFGDDERPESGEGPDESPTIRRGHLTLIAG